LGRTQACTLLDETRLVPTEGEARTLGEIFFDRACTQGKPKRNQVLRPFGATQQEPSGLLGPVEVAHKIAERLNETEPAPSQQIIAIVRALGQVQAWALMLDAFEIDAGDGILVPDGSRRRTVGGIFFYLAYTKGVPLPGKTLKRTFHKGKASPKPVLPNKKPDQQQPDPVVKPMTAFNWKDRIATIQEAEGEKGNANVKITLVGRPGKIVDRGTCMVTVMESSKIPALPKGLPTPPAGPTRYTVYIGSKQWRKVAEAISDPEDTLIIEGFPTIDTQTGTVAVFATNTTTKHLQVAQKEAQKAKSEETPL
jgi:hypothetical protein